MKTLFAIRHAKSSWSDTGVTDHERPLNERGRRDCASMAQALRERQIVPDVILSSSAVRTRATAESLASALDRPADDIRICRDWYLASAARWLEAIQQIDEGFETAFVVGHNPGMNELADRILRHEVLPDFPTLAIAWIELDVSYWGEADWKTGRLREFLTPRNLTPS